jgi:hypothetical protein
MEVLPSSQRSLEEVIRSTYISKAFGLLDRFKESLLLADHCDKSDFALQLTNTFTLLFDYDPVKWHDEDRIEQDVHKTEKMLKRGSLVVRERVGVEALPIKHDKLIQIVVLKNAKPHELMYEFAQRVGPHVPEPYKTMLADITPENYKHDRELTEFGRMVFKEIHPDYDTKVRERNELFQRLSLELDGADFTKIPLSTLESRFNACIELKLTPKQIASNPKMLMFKPDTLDSTFQWLRTTLKWTPEKIATCPLLLTYKSDTLDSSAQWLDSNDIEWRDNPDFLRRQTRMKETLAFMVDECKIERSFIKKSHMRDFKTIHKTRKTPQFMTLTSREKIHILMSKNLTNTQ